MAGVARGILLVLVLCGAVWAQEERGSERRVTPMEYTVGVFLFANQTYDPDLGYLEAGFRDIIAQTLALHPRVTVLDALRLDRAMRRRGHNPRRPLPYNEAAEIARELEADRAISGTLYQRGEEVIVQAQMVLLEDPAYQWTPEFSLTLEGDPVVVGVEIAKYLLRHLPVEDEGIAPEFLVGSHLTIKVASNAPEVALRMVNDPVEASMSLRGFKILGGKTLGQVIWDEKSRTVFISAAPGTTGHDWIVELDAVVTCEADHLRLAMGATPGSRAELKITNENLLGEARVAKTFRLEPDTPRADALVSADAILRDAPVYLLARPFEAMEGSLPFHRAAEIPTENIPPAGAAEEGTGGDTPANGETA